MRYWVDGYNLLFRLPLSKESLQTKRERIIYELNEKSSELHLEITLVFDAFDRDRNLDSRSHYDFLEIIYTTSKETADESILESIEHIKNPSTICVVTSDKGLSRKAKNLGANAISLKEFFTLLEKKTKKKERPTPAFQESPKEIERLRKIFEKKLEES